MEEAGRDLDSLVARMVFGLVVIIDTQKDQHYIMGKNHSQQPLPPYSTDAETAHQIVDLVAPYGFDLVLNSREMGGRTVWGAAFKRKDGKRELRTHVAYYGDTLAAAICAAGLAIMEKHSNQRVTDTSVQ